MPQKDILVFGIISLIKKIEHIGILVKDINSSNEIFNKILGKKFYKKEKVDSENVLTSFFQIDKTKIELIKSYNKNDSLEKFLKKRGEGIHHIALLVDDIYSEIKRIKNEGIRFINEHPKKGADNKLICFLHPKDTNGVLIELCQEI